MQILSFLSIMTSVLYVMSFVKRLGNRKGDSLVQVSLGVFLCLGWWAMCDAFFYVAPTESIAWFWLKLGAIGWNGFIPATAYYFIVMRLDNNHIRSMVWHLCYWAPSVILTVLFGVSDTTALADKLVQSSSGLGWTYQQSFSNVLPFLLFIELAVYLGAALLHLFIWQRGKAGADIQMLAKGFIVLDATAVLVGIFTIYVIPHYTIFLPPFGFAATLIFLAGYWVQLSSHDLMHIELALDPSSVFDNSLDAIVITDVAWNILYVNSEAKRILLIDKAHRTSFTEFLQPSGQSALDAFRESQESRQVGMELELSTGTPLFCSISRAVTRKHRHTIYIFSLYDATFVKTAQQKLDYLAHYDELTGLPNRRRLGELLDQWEEKFHETGNDFSVFFLDLNRFKLINDNYGHEAGDRALQETAKALQSVLFQMDVAARLAGDEFIVLHENSMIENLEEEQEMIKKIQEAIRQVDCSSFAPGVTLEASVGICRYSEAGNIRKLFKLADERMYLIKQNMHDSYEKKAPESSNCIEKNTKMD